MDALQAPAGGVYQCNALRIAPGIAIKINPLRCSSSVCHIQGPFHALGLIIIKILQDNMTASRLFMETLRLKEVKPLVPGYTSSTFQNWASVPNPSVFRSAVYSLHPKASCIFPFHMGSVRCSTFWYLKILTVQNEKIPISHIRLSISFWQMTAPYLHVYRKSILNPCWKMDGTFWYLSRSLKHTFLLEMTLVDILITPLMS